MYTHFLMLRYFKVCKYSGLNISLPCVPFSLMLNSKAGMCVSNREEVKVDFLDYT